MIMFNSIGQLGTDETAKRKMKLALAVAGDYLVFGSESSVAQAIRDISRKDIETIDSDPMYQYTKRYLPSEAGILCYENQQITSEMGWSLLKEQAIIANKNKTAQTNVPNELKNCAADDDEENFESDIVIATPKTPIAMVVEQLRDYCDFNLLPEFKIVKKYFGTSFWYITSNDQAITMEFCNLKAPQ